MNWHIKFVRIVECQASTNPGFTILDTEEECPVFLLNMSKIVRDS